MSEDKEIQGWGEPPWVKCLPLMMREMRTPPWRFVLPLSREEEIRVHTNVGFLPITQTGAAQTWVTHIIGPAPHIHSLCGQGDVHTVLGSPPAVSYPLVHVHPLFFGEDLARTKAWPFHREIVEYVKHCYESSRTPLLLTLRRRGRGLYLVQKHQSTLEEALY